MMIIKKLSFFFGEQREKNNCLNTVQYSFVEVYVESVLLTLKIFHQPCK